MGSCTSTNKRPKLARRISSPYCYHCKQFFDAGEHVWGGKCSLCTRGVCGICLFSVETTCPTKKLSVLKEPSREKILHPNDFYSANSIFGYRFSNSRKVALWVTQSQK
jgi:hypothetical protein